MNTDNKKLMSNGVVYLASSIIAQLINLCLIPIYTRNISQAQFGQYNIINALQQLLSIGTTLGVFSGMCRFFNEYEEKEELKNTAVTFSILWGGLCIVIMYFLTPHISDYIFKNDLNANKYIYLIVIISILSCVISIYGSYYSMQFKAVKASIINIIVMILTFVFALYLVVNLQRGIIGILEAQLYSKLIMSIILLFFDLKTLKFRIYFEKLKIMLKYSIGLLPGQISSWILTLVDRYFIKGMIDLEAVGLYSMGYKIGMLINPVFINPFRRVFTAYKFSVYKEENGKKKIKNIFDYYNFIGWFCILGLALYAKFAILILSTDEYIIAFKVVPLIAFSYFLWGIGEFYALGLHIANKMLLNSLIVTIAAILNIGVNLMLIPIIGIYGAALSTIIAYIIANILYFYFGKKYYDLEVNLMYPYKFGIVFIIIYTLYLYLSQYINNIWIEFILNIVLCLSYILISLLFGFISKNKLKKIIFIIRRKFNFLSR